jgi:hypothetical protein
MGVKSCLWSFLTILGSIDRAMSSAGPETVDDLLRHVLEDRRFTAWCKETGIRPLTVRRWRKGQGSRVHTGTVAVVAHRLGITRERLLAAIAESRAAAQQ